MRDCFAACSERARIIPHSRYSKSWLRWLAYKLPFVESAEHRRSKGSCGVSGPQLAYLEGGYETGLNASSVAPEVEAVLTGAMKKLLNEN
jgi:hypothetical protein